MRLVIDTDVGSDDAVALMLALAEPGVQVEAITTVAGNVPLEQATTNALLTLDVMGARVPVHPGRPGPLRRDLQTAQQVHGEDGMGDAGWPAPTGRPSDEHAVDVLLRLANSHPGELTLVTLAPLSNVATAVLRDPELLHKFRDVYCMAGVPDAHGNVSESAEYNVWADPEAADIVLRAGRLPTFIGWNVSRTDAVITPDDQRRLAALGTRRARFLLDANATVRQWCEEVTGLNGFDLPDPIAMAVALRPSLVQESERAHVRVGMTDEARGVMFVDRRVAAPPANAEFVMKTDSAAFKDMLFELCADQSAVA